LLQSKKDKLTILAEQLLEKEVLFQSDLEALVGPRPFEQLTSYQEFIKGETEKKRQDAKDERQLAEDKKQTAKKSVAKAKDDVGPESAPVKKASPRKRSPKKED
jgi:cell division protease FtsH